MNLGKGSSVWSLVDGALLWWREHQYREGSSPGEGEVGWRGLSPDVNKQNQTTPSCNGHPEQKARTLPSHLSHPPPALLPNPTPAPSPNPGYIYHPPRSNSCRLPPINGPHGAHRRVVKRLWAEGQRRGISATEMPGFDSRAAKKNSPQESQESFRTHPPPLDRRGALGGELFGFSFLLCCFVLVCRVRRPDLNVRRRYPRY